MNPIIPSFASSVLEVIPKKNADPVNEPSKKPPLELAIGQCEEDSPFDQALHKMRMEQWVDEMGLKKSKDPIFIPSPSLEPNQVERIRQFIHRPNVENVLYFTPEILEEARQYFRSPMFLKSNKGKEHKLHIFLQSKLLTGQDKILQYWMNPLEFYSRLYSKAKALYVQEGLDERMISVEIVGGHAREILFHDEGTTSWVKSRLEQVCSKLNLSTDFQNEVLKRLLEKPADSDTRFTLPGASVETLNELSYEVVKLIVEQISHRYPIFQDEDVRSYLEIFIRQCGLEKFRKAPLISKDKNIYSIAVAKSGSQKVEFLFVNKIERPCIFDLDSMRVPIKFLIDPYSTSIIAKPYAGTADDIQWIFDNLSYVLHYPMRALVDPTILIRTFSHQILGARCLEADLELLFLRRLLKEPLKEGVKPEVGLANLISDQIVSCSSNHGRGDQTYAVALALRTLCSLKKHEKELPKGLINKTLQKLEPLLRALPTQQNDLLFQHILRPLIEAKVNFDTVYYVLQFSVLFRLNIPFDKENPFKAFITRDGMGPALQLKNGFIFQMTCEMDRASTELIKIVERLVGEGDALVLSLFEALLPDRALDFASMTPLKRHLGKLNLDLKALEDLSIKCMESSKPLLKKLGFHLLLTCHDLNPECNQINILFERLPSLLDVENRFSEIFLNSFENLLKHRNLIPKDFHFFSATLKKIRLKKKSTDSFQVALIEDILSSGYKPFEDLAIKMWRDYALSLSENRKTLNQMGLALLREIKLHPQFNLMIFRSLQEANVLSFGEMLPIFEDLVSSLSQAKDCLSTLHKAALNLISKRDLPPKGIIDKKIFVPSREMPKIVVKLTESNLTSEAYDLLLKSAEKLFIDPLSLAFKKCWILLCKNALEALSFNSLNAYCRKAQELKIWSNLEGGDEFELLFEFIERLLKCEDEKSGSHLNFFLSILSEKKWDEKNESRLSELVSRGFNKQLLANPPENHLNIQKQYQRQYKNLLRDANCLQFQLIDFQNLVETGSALSAVPSLRMLLQNTLDDTSTRTCLKLTEKLVIKLCDANSNDNFDRRFAEVYSLLKLPAFVELIKKGAGLQRKFTFLYFNSNNFPNIGWMLLDLLKNGASLDAAETKKVVDFTAKILDQTHPYSKEFGEQLKAHLPRLLEACQQCGFMGEAWSVLTHLVNRKIELEMQNPLASCVFEFAAGLMEEPEMLPKVHYVLTSLNWFKRSNENYLKMQVDCYIKLIGLTVKRDHKMANLWIRRCLELSKDNLPADLLIDWAQTILPLDFSVSIHLFSMIKKHPQLNRNKFVHFLYQYVEDLQKLNLPATWNILMQQSDYLIEHPHHLELVRRIIRPLRSELKEIENMRKVLQILCAYRIFDNREWLDLISQVEKYNHLELVDLLSVGWENMCVNLQLDVFEIFLSKMLHLQLEANDAAILKSLDKLKLMSKDFNIFFSHSVLKNWDLISKDLLPKIAYYLDDFFRKNNLNHLETLLMKAMLQSEIKHLVNYANLKFLAKNWEIQELYTLVPQILFHIKKYPQLKTEKLLVALQLILHSPADFNEKQFIYILIKIAEGVIADDKLIYDFFLFALENVREYNESINRCLYLTAVDLVLKSYGPNINKLIGEERFKNIFAESDTDFLKGLIVLDSFTNAALSPKLEPKLMALETAYAGIKAFENENFPRVEFCEGYAKLLLCVLFESQNPLLVMKYLFKLENSIQEGVITNIPPEIADAKIEILTEDKMIESWDAAKSKMAQMVGQNNDFTLEELPSSFYTIHTQILDFIFAKHTNSHKVNALLICLASAILINLVSKKTTDDDKITKLLDLQKKFVFWEAICDRKTFLLQMYFLSRIKMAFRMANGRYNFKKHHVDSLWLIGQYLIYPGPYPSVYYNFREEGIEKIYPQHIENSVEPSNDENPLVILPKFPRIGPNLLSLLSRLKSSNSLPLKVNAIEIFSHLFKQKQSKAMEKAYSLQLFTICSLVFDITATCPFIELKLHDEYERKAKFGILGLCLPVNNDPREFKEYLFEKVQHILLDINDGGSCLMEIITKWLNCLSSFAELALKLEDQRIVERVTKTILHFFNVLTDDPSLPAREKLYLLHPFTNLIQKLLIVLDRIELEPWIELLDTSKFISNQEDRTRSNDFYYELVFYWIKVVEVFRLKIEKDPNNIEINNKLSAQRERIFNKFLKQRLILLDMNPVLAAEIPSIASHPLTIFPDIMQMERQGINLDKLVDEWDLIRKRTKTNAREIVDLTGKALNDMSHK